MKRLDLTALYPQCSDNRVALLNITLPVAFVTLTHPSLGSHSSLSIIALWSFPGKASLTSGVLIASIHSLVQSGTGDWSAWHADL